MLPFKKFMNLNESLDSAIEFYMTEDTEMPKQIYAAFDLEDETYGCSLVLTGYDRVYQLDFYRVVNKKRRNWSFKKPSHIRKCLSTVIKFTESSLPFVKVKMDGLLIPLPTASESTKYEKFLSRLIKKSYIKTYRSVPVEKKTDKARNYMFMVKQSVKPEQIFKSAAFHKHFNFDTSVTSIDSVGLDYIDLYKKQKSNISIKPSSKYVFGKLAVEFDIGEDLISALDNATLATVLSKDTNKDYTPKLVYDNGVINDGGSVLTSTIEGNEVRLSLTHIFANIMTAAFYKIKEHGFDKKKIIWDDFKYAFNSSISSQPKFIKELLKENFIVNETYDLRLTDANKALFLDILEAFEKIDEKDVISMTDKLPDSIKNGGSKEIKSEVLKLDVEPMSEVPGFESSNLSSAKKTSYSFSYMENGENVKQKIESVLSMPEVKFWYKNYIPFGNKYERALRSYTGSYSEDMNSNLRNGVLNKDLSKFKFFSQTEDLLTYFIQSAPRLSAGIWVYRNGYAPDFEKFKVGDDIIDPGFMSTTVRSSMGLGDNRLRLKIYLPKGTKCFPIFNKSSHSSENEIVLPPFSALKILETHDGVNTNISNQRHFLCTYYGTAMESFKNAVEKEYILEQNEENKKDNPEEKWNSPMISAEEMKKIKELILKKKLKLK